MKLDRMENKKKVNTLFSNLNKKEAASIVENSLFFLMDINPNQSIPSYDQKNLSLFTWIWFKVFRFF